MREKTWGLGIVLVFDSEIIRPVLANEHEAIDK